MKLIGQANTEKVQASILVSNLASLRVKGSFTGYISETEGTGTLPYNVGGDFTGGLSAGKNGKTPSSIVVKGNFRPYSTSTSALVSGQVVQNVTVTGNLGGTLTGEILGRIDSGSSIGDISSLNGNILLDSITANNGTIDAIGANSLAEGKGRMSAAVTARGGNVGPVEANVIAGNVSAFVSTKAGADKSANGGGNIFLISSKNAIPKTVKFAATWYISEIKVDNPGTDPELFQVSAQGGTKPANAARTFQGQAPLIINVGTGTYFGKVTFATPDAKSNIPSASYKSGAVLLTVIATTDGKQTTTNWTVAGDDPNPTTVNAVFTLLTSGVFGWVKNPKGLSNEELTISGPQGEAK